MTLIKICGIREHEHAVAAAEAGADLVGFVFVPVPRQVGTEVAREIISSMRQQFDRPAAAVGLFVNESAETVNGIVGEVDLDFVQLSGDETPDLASEIERPVIKAVRIKDGMTPADVENMIEAHLQHSVAVLLDSHVAGRWGGTGVVGDWDAAADLASRYPMVLAGGLNPDNAAGAIERVNPAAVDVSSGVETAKRKDTDKIRAFVAAARTAGRDPGPAAMPLVNAVRASRNRSGITN
jgi:phosphoribosylanthranilate isomerase